MKRLSLVLVLVLGALLLCTTTRCQVIKGTFAIKNVETGMLLRIKDANKKDGTPLVSYTPVNWKCMTWDFLHAGGQTYQLRNLYTGKTFEPNANQSAAKSLGQQPFLLDNIKQQYEFIPVTGGVYWIRLKDTELYLTPSTSDGASNSEVVLLKKGKTRLQHWTIYEQNPEL